ncbi:Hypothetical Protein SLY_0878 [Strawberry lethal yellows phytoplasma (CPA) str. NZSb11]|uniref:Uncharacterized protein n=1 Tax=Strawberry lethal yellows phytoplasma (CPA) str. NZSb11 TaxID=980422 RepID=R4RXZ9_PHYAS|nr:Hypothetical Protein SLY_0878 [Strawberry lethal yellows phytoplasma (CPA) str. NZSb11]
MFNRSIFFHFFLFFNLIFFFDKQKLRQQIYFNFSVVFPKNIVPYFSQIK